MEFLTLYGLLGALVIGVVLGLTGSGGSILTVPVLVYLLSVNPVTATAYSLFVVGTTSLFGTIKNVQKGMIEYRIAFVLAVPAFIAVYLTRKLIVPSIPDIIIYNNFVLTKELFLMLFFAFVMLMASVSMIITRKEVLVKEAGNLNYTLMIFEGFVIGVITGLVGAGGGFLIIPTLVIFANLSMKKAVATSLMIIAIKSLIGFLGDVGNVYIDWEFLLLFTALSIAGIVLGIYLSNFIEGKKLKKAFGWFVLSMAIYVIIKELIF
ncbi:sulfite exporter TauE/SafE family protein [Flavobacteriales bacterium]|nr:sulfite exporter TauE/SafE family protein [Flavobacteriales bacterium]